MTKDKLANQVRQLEKQLEKETAEPPADDQKIEDLDKKIEDLMQNREAQADEIGKLQGEKLELMDKIEELQEQLEKAAETETRLRKKKGAKYSAYGHDNLTLEEYNQILKDKSD